MDEITLSVTVRLEVDDDGEVRVVGSSADAVRVGTLSSDGEVPPRIEEMVQDNAARNLDLYMDYLGRCTRELGAELAPPSSGDRAYVNVYPPKPFRRKRLAALNPRSGRVHCDLSPDLVDRWPLAEVVFHGERPAYLRIYLRSPESVDQAIDMARTALDEREGSE